MKKELRDKASKALIDICNHLDAKIRVPGCLSSDLMLQGVARLEDGVYMASFLVKTIYEMRLAIVFNGTQAHLERMIRNATVTSMWVHERFYYPNGPFFLRPLWYRENLKEFLLNCGPITKDEIKTFLMRLRAA